MRLGVADGDAELVPMGDSLPDCDGVCVALAVCDAVAVGDGVCVGVTRAQASAGLSSGRRQASGLKSPAGYSSMKAPSG